MDYVLVFRHPSISHFKHIRVCKTNSKLTHSLVHKICIIFLSCCYRLHYRSSHQALQGQRRFRSCPLLTSYCTSQKHCKEQVIISAILLQETCFFFLLFFYLSQLSLMSLVVLQLLPTGAPQRAGCISPLTRNHLTYSTHKSNLAQGT